MKILVVCQHFDPEQFRINDIVYQLSNNGHNVTVLTGLPNYPKGKIYAGYTWFRKRKEVLNGVKVIRSFTIGRGNNLLMLGLNYASFAIFASIKAIKLREKFDVIYVYQLSPITMAIPGIIVKKLKKIPLIIHCLDQWPISVTAGPIRETSYFYKILYKISRKIYKSADLITISSKSFLMYFRNVLNLSESRIVYWPSYAEEIYSDIGHVENDVFDLLFAGNIGPAQSVETIIEAAKILSDNKKVFFHIVGDGLSRKICETMVDKYKLTNVKFYGYHPIDQIRQFYEIADAFLVTMVNNEVVNQTLPAKIQSYMLAGKPIIGAVSGEVKQVINEAGCGVCCESLDYEKFAENIRLIVSGLINIEKFGENGKQYYHNNFSKTKCMSDLENLLQTVILNNDYS